MRKTKIVCTLGPATDNEDVLRKLMLAGMNVARLNFSHGTHEEQKKRMDMVKKLRAELGLPIAILLDTKGPEIRTRDFEGGKAELKAGDFFTLTTRDLVGDSTITSITYKDLYKDVQIGTHILIDDGLIELQVTSISGEDILCTVITGGPVSNHKGINVPDVHLNMPYLSEVDQSDILFGIEQDVDFVAASFVRSAKDVLEIRELLNAMVEIISTSFPRSRILKVLTTLMTLSMYQMVSWLPVEIWASRFLVRKFRLSRR